MLVNVADGDIFNVVLGRLLDLSGHRPAARHASTSSLTIVARCDATHHRGSSHCGCWTPLVLATDRRLDAQNLGGAVDVGWHELRVVGVGVLKI